MDLQNVNHIEPKAQITQADWEQWLGNWIWRSVHCLVEAPGFNPSPKAISKKLNISVEKAVEAIEGLERLGCITRDGISFKVVDDWFQLSPLTLDRSRLLSAQAKIAPQLISKLTDQDAFTSQFFLGNKEIVKKYSSKFMDLFKQMNDEAVATNATEVVAAQISFVQLSSTQESVTGGLQ